MGSPAFAVPALEAVRAHHEVALVVTQPDRPAGRGRRSAPPPVKEAAERAGLPILQPRATKKPAFSQALAETAADVGVVVAYGRILPRSVLDAFPLGCVNIHASLLPKYRGAAPVPWAILRGEGETGVTIMRLDEGMDTGPVLASRRAAIGSGETAGELGQRLAAVGANLLIETLADLEAGRAEEREQDHAAASYAPPLTKADGEIEFSRAAPDVRNHILAVDPWPGATTALRGERVKLFSPSVASDAPEGGAPGQVLACGGGVVVACGEGAVRIGEIQPPGKRRMPAEDFARGRGLAPGERLGAAD